MRGIAPVGCATRDRLSQYLRSIVLNAARTRFATRARHRRITDRFGTEPSGTVRVVDLDPMRQVDDREALRAALDRLTLRQRICVVCRYWLGLTDVETAAATGLSLGTVKTHLRRALSALRVDFAVDAVTPTRSRADDHVLEENHVC